MHRKRIGELVEKLVYIYIECEPWSIEIGLQYAIHTVNRAVCAGVEDLVITALVFTCSRARFKKNTPVVAEI
jgi:hypothetical protein